jgi:predicted neuraminidase
MERAIVIGILLAGLAAFLGACESSDSDGSGAGTGGPVGGSAGTSGGSGGSIGPTAGLGPAAATGGAAPAGGTGIGGSSGGVAPAGGTGGTTGGTAGTTGGTGGTTDGTAGTTNGAAGTTSETTVITGDFPHSFSYSGKVTNFAGEPIAGATVKLDKTGASVTTAGDGTFDFAYQSASEADTVFDDSLVVTQTGYLEYETRMYNQPDAAGLVIRLANIDLPVIEKELLFDPMPESKPFKSNHAPSVLELPDGTLLSVFFAGDHEGAPDQKIYICRKEFGGEWTAPQAIADGGGNPSLFQSRTGKLMRFDGWNGKMQTSTDEGLTWSTPRGTSGGGAEKNKPLQLEDGTILAVNEDSVIASTDDGETWSERSGGAKQGTLLIYPDNRIQMMYRTGGGGSIGVNWSDDNGMSWSGADCILPNNNSGVDGSTLRDGTQLLAYNHSHRNSGGHKGRGILNIAISKDGIAWDAVMLVDYLLRACYQYSYPAVIQSRDGLVHLVYTWHRRSIGHAVMNPAAFQPVPMPDGQWPTSGPLSIEEWKTRNPGWDSINLPDLCN